LWRSKGSQPLSKRGTSPESAPARAGSGAGAVAVLDVVLAPVAEHAPLHGTQAGDHHQRQGRGADGHPEQAQPAEHAHRGVGPDVGGRGDPDHAVAAEEDHPGAEEADAAHHLGGDAADVGTGRARHVEGAEAGDGEGGGAERDQRVGAHPRRLGGQLTLGADQHAERGGERHPAEQLGLGGTGHSRQGTRPAGARPGGAAVHTAPVTTGDSTRILLIRHAKAGSRERWEGDDRQRALTRSGRRQAEALVEQLRDEPIERVLSSPYLRCIQTVEPLAAARGLRVEPTDDLAEGAGIGPLLRLLAELGNAALSTHGDVIQEFVEWLHHRGVAVDGGLAKGSTWVLDVVHGEVVAARYLPPPA
jgi:8-oxo-dGTP diphosphatase